MSPSEPKVGRFGFKDEDDLESELRELALCLFLIYSSGASGECVSVGKSHGDHPYGSLCTCCGSHHFYSVDYPRLCSYAIQAEPWKPQIPDNDWLDPLSPDIYQMFCLRLSDYGSPRKTSSGDRASHNSCELYVSILYRVFNVLRRSWS